MKDALNPAALERIAAAMTGAWKGFPRARFLREARAGLDAGTEAAVNASSPR
ncbi:MAG: hypothetical protein U1G05_15485 [Kiritimatiellia bacterium]